MKNVKAKALAEGLICSALSVLFIIMALYIPILVLPMMIASGIPVIFLGTRHGLKVSVAALLVSVLAAFFLTNDIGGAAMLGVVFILPGVVAGEIMPRRAEFSTKVFATSAVVLFGIILNMILINSADGGKGIENIINGSISTAAANIEKTVTALSGGDAEKFKAIYGAAMDSLNLIRAMIFMYIPSFIIGFAVVTGYLTFTAGAAFLRKFRKEVYDYRPFCLIYAPRAICYTTMIMSIVVTFSGDGSVATAALRNIVALMNAYLAVCGLCLIDFKFKDKISSGVVRTVIYIMALFIGNVLLGFIYQGLGILGMIDGVFDFRRLQKVGGKYDRK